MFRCMLHHLKADHCVTCSKPVWFLQCCYKILTYWLTYSMEQSPSWRANQFLASQEIPRILWNPKVHYHIHKCPPPVPIFSQHDPVHTTTSHFLKIQLNIILPSTPGYPTWSLSLRFPHQNPLYTSPLPHTSYIPRPSHSSRFYHPNNNGWAVQTIKLHRPLSSSLSCFLHSPLTSSSTQIFSSAPCSQNTLSLRSSLNFSDQVSHPYKRTGDIICGVAEK